MEGVQKILLDILTELRKSNSKYDKLEQRLNELENQDQLLSATDAARMLGVSIPTIYNWEQRGLISRKARGGKKGYSYHELTSIRNI